MVGYLLFVILLKIVRWFVLNFQSFYQQAMVYKTLYRTLKIEQHELLLEIDDKLGCSINGTRHVSHLKSTMNSTAPLTAPVRSPTYNQR